MSEIVCLTNSRNLLRIRVPFNLPFSAISETIERILEAHYRGELERMRKYGHLHHSSHRRADAESRRAPIAKQFQARKLSTRETLSAANMTPSDSNFPEDKTVHCQNNNKSAVQNTGEVRVRKVSDIKTLSESVTARKSSGSAAESFDPPPSAKSFPSWTKSPSSAAADVSAAEDTDPRRKASFSSKFDSSIRKTSVEGSNLTSSKRRRSGLALLLAANTGTEHQKADDDGGPDSGVFSEIYDQEAERRNQIKKNFLKKLLNRPQQSS